jgi:hypothetical protein
MIKYNYERFQNVANVLVKDELSSTYVWILQCLLKATNNMALKSFWLNSEPGLINAVAQIFPNILHFYCFYYIWQNIIKHLKGKLDVKLHLFSKAFYSYRNASSIKLFGQC